MMLPSVDFESTTSTNSITPATWQGETGRLLLYTKSVEIASIGFQVSQFSEVQVKLKGTLAVNQQDIALQGPAVRPQKVAPVARRSA